MGQGLRQTGGISISPEPRFGVYTGESDENESGGVEELHGGR